ncbi:MAG: hypothetical protein K6U08_06855, partial [Firmicutes bacterium]|nr:hypothetical protein [Bacillota bacterium]
VRGTLKDYEDAIRQIREVMAVRVVPGSRGEIDEIHVLAGNGRAAKQIVRDIESSLLAQFGVSVDHKKISVAQVEESASLGWSMGRPRLVGLRVTTDNSRIEAEVKVAFEDIVHTGTAGGAATQTNRLRVPAQAALEAVAAYFNSGHEIALDDVLVVNTRRNLVVLAVLSLLTRDGEQTLSGSCAVRDSEGEAAVRAVLDALNRRFTLLVRAPGQRPGLVPPGNGPES